MTSRERWLALLAGERPDRVPTDYWATTEVTQRLMRELHCRSEDELFRRLDIDAPYTLAAPRTSHTHPGDPQAGIWGVRYTTVDYGGGTYGEATGHPLVGARSAEDIHAFRWPSPDDHDFDAFAEAVDHAPPDRMRLCGNFEPFLLYCSMRGMEQAYMDLLLEPQIAEAALEHIFDYHFRLNRRMFEIAQGQVDLIYMAEDLGSQNGLLMGIEQIRRFLLPNQKRMADLARSYGIHVFYHSDGAVREAIPDLIEVTGIEILNPLQWRCPGMDRRELVRDFGERIIFHGGIDNQWTLPFGTPDDVRREVLQSIEIFGPARWICAPCHNIQPVTPTENILAMYAAIREQGH